MPQEKILYLGLLAIQTAVATSLFWIIFPLFRQMIERLGEPQDLAIESEIAILVATLVLHCAYWARHRWSAVAVGLRSVFLGHVIQFAGRTSFFFGGALFSVIFFRHVPELDALPPMEQGIVQGGIVMWVLFALFCYSLELDRLGKIIEGP